MTRRRTRRQVLATGALAGMTGLAGCDFDSVPVRDETSTATPADQSPRPTKSNKSTDASFEAPVPVDVRGAMYLPARAFNTYQMWRETPHRVFERDMGYAERLNLNAVRTWLSYEYWLEAPERHGKALEAFLTAASDRGIQVLLGLFEGVGDPPTEENLTNDDPLTATATYSPGPKVVRNESKWGKPREFVRWVMDRYRDDDRLLAIEVMNEPGWSLQEVFAGGMFETMVAERGSVPLTVGSTSLANNINYLEWGSEVIQFHYNFPSTAAVLRSLLDQATDVAARTETPVWMTEWQRVRSGRGFLSKVEGTEWQPNNSSLAPLFSEAGVGNFFWSLMIKPAYVTAQREQGVISGVFHEDGAVWSHDDARAIKGTSGEASFDGEVRQEWPEWLRPVKKDYLRG